MPTKILKKQTVRLAGQKTIDAYLLAQAGRHAPAAKAQIVGQEDGCVIIQVTCGCGQEIQLRCDTAPAPRQTPPGKNTPTPNQGVAS